MLYTTATQREYPVDSNHLPEEINVVDTIMNYSIRYQKDLLRQGVGPSNEQGSNWTTGFDTAFLTKVYWRWNATSTYGVQVLAKAKQYVPK